MNDHIVRKLRLQDPSTAQTLQDGVEVGVTDGGFMTRHVDTRPIGARVGPHMIGSTSGDQPIAWSERDTILYALGVGAGMGDPECELQFTTENSGGISLQTLPSFMTTLTLSAKTPALESLDIARLLHAEQEIEVLKPLPPSGEGLLRTEVESVLDKGSGAIVTSVSTLKLGGSSGPVIAHGRMSIFVRGGGGFGSERGPRPAVALYTRDCDVRITHQSRPEQALLYRLSGDRHRLHSDPLFAREHGFDRPILHGLCTYGFACRALIEAAAGGNPRRLKGMRGRFRKPTYPGDALTTEIWRQSAGTVLFRTLDGCGDAVIEHGVATIASKGDDGELSQLP